MTACDHEGCRPCAACVRVLQRRADDAVAGLVCGRLLERIDADTGVSDGFKAWLTSDDAVGFLGLERSSSTRLDARPTPLSVWSRVVRAVRRWVWR